MLHLLQSLLQLLLEIRSGDFLKYLALVLAYIAYTWSVNRDFNSWKSLFISFKNDLESQKEWLKNEYFEENYNDQDSFSPKKIIYPLSFESLPEIIRRGVEKLPNISEKFLIQISIFNERVIAFNSLLDQIKKINSANPITTEKLIDKLNDLGINDRNLNFNEFKKQISQLKKEDDTLYLAENNRRLHRLLHVKLIGNKNKQDKLHFLYSEISKELEKILNNFDSLRPHFVRFKWVYVGISVPVFFFIETFLH